jgi:hypothetical protein
LFVSVCLSDRQSVSHSLLNLFVTLFPCVLFM